MLCALIICVGHTHRYAQSWFPKTQPAANTQVEIGQSEPSSSTASVTSLSQQADAGIEHDHDAGANAESDSEDDMEEVYIPRLHENNPNPQSHATSIQANEAADPPLSQILANSELIITLDRAPGPSEGRIGKQPIRVTSVLFFI